MDEQYILDLWKWTTSQDPTFTQRYTFDSWKNKLQDNSQYREDFHGWVSSVDPTFSKRRPLNDWSKLVSNQAVDIQSQVTGGIVKKKDDTRSVGQIIGDYQESLASGSEDGLSESPTITEVSDVSVTEEVPAQPEEQPITSSEVLGYDYTDPEVRNYVQSLGEGAETELRKIQKKKLLDQLQSNKTTEEKKEIADNLRLIDDLNLKEKGIINLANAPTVEEFLAGQETIADIDRGLISSLVQSGNDKAAKLLYNQQLKSIQDQQKKEAGFVEFNGEFYDPSDLPTGYGFNTALESVDFSTVAGRDEEAVANNLLSKFSQYGFDFQQSGILDNVTITSPLGNTLEVSVDNFTDAGDAESGRQIKRFLLTEYLAQELSPEQDVAKAMVSPADLSQVGMGTEFDYEDYYTEAGYDTRRASMIEEDSLAIRDLNEAIEAEGKIAEQAKQELMTLENALNKDPFNPKLRSQYESKRLQVEGLNLKIERQNKLRNKAVNNYNNILNEMNYSLGQRALNYVEWDISNLPELFLGEMSRGTAEMLSGYIDIAGDAANLYNFVHEGITGDKLFTDAELKEWKKSTKAPIKQAGEILVGAMFSGDLDPAEMLQDGSVTIKDGKLELGGERVSNQTVAEFNKQGWLAKGLTGTMRSVPAIMTGPLRLASFYAMGSESLNEQLNNIPELANLSEAEKLKIKIPLGLGNAVLEEFGMRRVLQNSSFVSNLFLKSLRQFSKKPVAQQTARTFRETVVKNLGNSVGGKVAKTALLSASSGAAEYETGLLQEFLDVYGKEFYDLANESDYFKNVVTLQDEEGNFSLDNATNMEVLEAAHYAGLAEMVGGIVMGMPSAVTQASQSFEFNEISDGHFELFKQVSEVENVEDFLVQQRATLDASVGLVINEDTGELTTQEEADAKMREYEILIGVKNTIPAEFSPEYGKKILYLARQQKQLKEEIKNLDKSASNEQQRRLKIIEEDIAELSRAAEKELAESTREYEAQKKAGETDLTFKAWRFQEMMKKSVREATKKEEETEEAVEETGEVVEQTAVTEEAPVTEQERAKIREILSEPAAQEQVVEEAPVVEQVTEDVVEETPIKEESIEEEELEFGENTFVYKMSRSTTPSGRGRWEADFEIIDNRPNEQGIRNDNTSDANWMVLNKITGEMLEATSKKDAQGIIKNAPAEAGIFGEGQQLDFTQLTPSQQKKFKKEFERQKATRSQDEVVEQVVEEAPVVEQVTEDVVEETPVKKEAPKIKTRKKKPLVKKEAQISEQVQKEIDRAERLRDRIVADKTNEKQRLRNSNLTRAQKIYRKEKLESEIIQTEKRYNNIITELKEGKRTQFQVKETQETKTDDSRYEEFVSVLKRSFPSVEVVTTQAEFDTLLNKTGANQLITKDQSVYGAVYQGKLYLNPSLENYNTPIHEFGHIWMNVAKEANPKLYEKGIGLVKGSEYEQQVKNNPAYKDSTEQEILEEALATAIGDKGEAFVKESKRKSFKDWLTTLYGFVRKLTGISKYTANQLDDITLDEFTQAVAVDLLSGEQLFEGAEITDMGDALQLQIIGENAELSQQVREDLAFAKAEQEAIDLAENEGGVEGFKISPDAIKEVTGWERGKDGKWRYEIQDGRLEKVENGTYKLGDIYDAPEFYKAYPDAKNIQVSIDVRKNGRENSWFFPETNSIEINVKNDYRVIQDLVHELQHYIQFKEGFAIGGNEQTFLQNPEIVEDLMKKKNQLLIDNEILRAMSFVIEQVEVSDAIIDVGLDSLFTKDIGLLEEFVDEQHKENLVSLGLISEDTDFNQMIEDYYFGEAYSGPGEIIGDKTKIRPKTFKGGLTEMQRRKMKIAKRDVGFDEVLGELYEIHEPIQEDLSKLGNHALYERLAGEVEARNATTRLLLSAEKRRKKSLESTEDVAREDQILFMGDQAAAMASMAEKSNVKPSMSAQNIINRARAAEIRDAVIVDYLMSEKELTRKQAVSAIKRANRGNLKDAVKRLFNNVEDITNIREKDAQLIKDILKFDRSITRADKIAQKKAKDEIKSRLKAIQRKSKGKLSQAQVLAVTNRFANVNLSSEKSIDSFVDYMQKVFSDVDYAAKMTSLNKSIKQAKKNIKSKIGRGADGLAYELRRLLNISPTIIPDSVLEEYSDLVTSFGERKTVLNLKDSAEVKETIAKIFEELSVQNSELSELSERFEAFEDKKFTKTGAVSFAKTVAQMLKDEVITEDEAKLMRKFKSEIMPIEKAEGKTEEEKQKELEEEKEILIKNIKKSSVNVEGIELAIEKALVKDFARLIKTNAINDLNNAQLKNIEKAIDNINNGYVTHYVQLASENLASINRSKTGAEGIRDAKPLAVSTQIAKIKTLFQKGSDANKFYKLIERNPLINIDMVLGDFSSKRIFNSVLEESAEAVTTFNTELNKVYNTIDDAEIQLQKKFKYNGNKIIESKYKQMAYMIQKEFESNPNNSQVSPAAAVMEVTIKKLRDNNLKYDADILQKILKNYSTDGEIDLKKLDDSFVYAELNMIKIVQEINSKLTDKATYTASVIRGESIEPLNNYIHQSVLNADGVAVEDSRALSESYMENIRPSTRAKNLIERTKGAKAINFDITASVRRGAKMTLLDYHLTVPLRTANRTLNKMEEQLDDTGQQRQIFLGIRDAYNQAISDILENTFTSSGISEQIFQYFAKQGYRSMLASIPRLFGELISNYSFAIFNPVEFIEGNKPKNMRVAFGEKGVEVMNNVKSKETTRLYGNEGLSGRFVETSMTDKKMGMSADSAQNPVINRLNQSLSYIKKYPRGVDAIADAMITTPDKLVTRPMWFGTFATEFKNITGQEVNFDKIAANDTEYMAKYEKAINEAKKKADSNSVLIGATDNPLQGILRNRKRASDGNFASAIKSVNTFMQRFLLFEYNAFRKGMYAAIGRGDISKGQGAALMTAVTARMTMYTIMVPLINSIIFGDADDDEEKESTYTRVYRAFVSTATNLFIGRGFGNIVKMAQNIFIEWANEEHGEDFGIREGEYNPYENSVQYNVVPPKKPYKQTDVLSDIFPNLLGAYSPFVKSIVFGINKLAAEEKKEKAARERQRREIEERLPLEIGGLTGFIPFYRDIRKSLMDDIYKDLRNKKKKKKKKKEIKYIR